MNRLHTPLLLVAALSSAWALPARAGDPAIPFETFTLDNGLQVIVSPDHRLPLVAVDTWYHVGAVDEVPGRSGFAHLFEHIMFQGSRNVPEDTYFRFLEGAGATVVNGTTDFDRTNYFETLPANQLELALWLESDRMGWLLDTLSQERLDNQKAVVRKERQQSVENVPYGPAEEKLYKLLYPAPHPYHGVVIGSHQDLEAATLADVQDFFRTWYSPNNATVVVCGDVTTEQVRPLVEKYYGAIPRGPQAPARNVNTVPITAERRERVQDEVELPKVFLAWVTSRAYHPGDADLQVAGKILGDGKTSRLYQKLVYEDRVAQSVNAYQYPLVEGSVFIVEVLGKAGQSPDSLEQAAWTVMQGLAAQGPTDEEVARARVSVEAGMLRGLERLGGFGGKADTLNAYNHYVKDPGFVAKDLARFRAVTPASVREQVAAQLGAQARVVVLVDPVKPAAAGAQESP